MNLFFSSLEQIKLYEIYSSLVNVSRIISRTEFLCVGQTNRTIKKLSNSRYLSWILTEISNFNSFENSNLL